MNTQENAFSVFYLDLKKLIFSWLSDYTHILALVNREFNDLAKSTNSRTLKTPQERITDWVQDLIRLGRWDEYFEKNFVQAMLPKNFSKLSVCWAIFKVGHVKSFEKLSELYHLNDEQNDALRELYDKDMRYAICAAKHGHLNLLKSIEKESLFRLVDFQRCQPLLEQVVMNNRLEILKWIYVDEFIERKSSDFVTECCVKYGKLEMIQWLVQRQQWRFSSAQVEKAAKFGHIDLIEYFVERGVSFTNKVLIQAASYGDLEKMKRIRALGAPLAQTIYDAAYTDYKVDNTLLGKRNKENQQAPLRSYRLDIWDWLNAENCEFSQYVCHTASCYGDMDAFRWMQKNNIPIDPESCMGAAFNNHYELLKYLRFTCQPPCPISQEALDIAAEKWPEVNWDETKEPRKRKQKRLRKNSKKK